MLVRLHGSVDIIAGDIIHQSLCLLKNTNAKATSHTTSGSKTHENYGIDSMYNQLAREMNYRLCRGQARLVSVC